MKKLLVVFAFAILFISFAKTADAAMFTKSDTGITKNVLGVSVDSQNAQQLVTSIENIISNVNFSLDGNSLTVGYEENDSQKKYSLDDFEGEIVEIKKENESDSLYVITEGDRFLLTQRGVFVTTTYPIEVQEKLENITLKTDSGQRYLTVLPYDALEPLLKTNVIDDISETGEIQLVELTEGELAYYILGKKSHNLFNLFNVDADVVVNVSALTGDVLAVNQPTWSKVLTFLSL